jgi:hypothetical protein
MIVRLVTLFAASIAIVVFAVGCGGGDDGSDSRTITVTTASLTRPQFTQKANAVCTTERRQLPPRVAAYEKKESPEGKSEDEAYAEEVKAVLLPTFQGEVTGISRIGAPAADQESVEEMLNAEQEAIDELSDMDSIESINVVADHFTQSNALMRKFKLVNCTIIAEPTS